MEKRKNNEMVIRVCNYMFDHTSSGNREEREEVLESICGEDVALFDEYIAEFHKALDECDNKVADIAFKVMKEKII